VTNYIYKLLGFVV